MPEEGIQLVGHQDILSFEEIINVVRVAVSLGIDKFRITGGEPLVRKDIVALISQIAAIGGVKDLSMTTNGIFLEELAQPLKDAGLHRINISLDTLDAEKFKIITRGGELRMVLRGIEAAQYAGLDPVKINCVVMESSMETDALAVKEFGRKNNLLVRFIHQMNLETGEFSIVEGGNGGNCHQCNRLRMTANGMVMPCLFDEQQFSVRELGAEKALLDALDCKPLNGCLNRIGSFSNIGG
jgi:cyclic pyranopterin phosphate synthase